MRDRNADHDDAEQRQQCLKYPSHRPLPVPRLDLLRTVVDGRSRHQVRIYIGIQIPKNQKPQLL
jgi:hypothetical protein